jgi:predicted NodU family carbamoyl transferase
VKILGISAYYHDSAACIVIEGEIIAAAQEERFTRKKHDPNFPINAISYCLSEAKITSKDIDYVVFYDKPFLKFERLLETYLAFAPRGYHALIKRFKELSGCPVIVNTSFNVRGEPIVCTPEDAFRCFMGTELDVLVVGNAILKKAKQFQSLVADYSGEYGLD